MNELSELIECIDVSVDLLVSNLSELAENGPLNIETLILFNLIDRSKNDLKHIIRILKKPGDVSEKDKVELTGLLLDTLSRVNNAFHFGGKVSDHVTEQKIAAHRDEKKNKQASIMRNARAPASLFANEMIKKHAAAILRSQSVEHSASSLAGEIESLVGADMTASGFKPIRKNAIAERIRKGGGVTAYKSWR